MLNYEIQHYHYGPLDSTDPWSSSQHHPATLFPSCWSSRDTSHLSFSPAYHNQFCLRACSVKCQKLVFLCSHPLPVNVYPSFRAQSNTKFLRETFSTSNARNVPSLTLLRTLLLLEIVKHHLWVYLINAQYLLPNCKFMKAQDTLFKSP